MLHSFHALRAQGSGPVVITTAIFRDDVGGSLERPMRRGIGQICKKGRRTPPVLFQKGNQLRSEEHTSELQSLMRTSYAGLCWKKKHKIDKTQCELIVEHN